MRVTFIKGLHDRDGDTYNTRLFLCFDDKVILAVDSIDDMYVLSEQIKKCADELAQNS